MIGIGFLLLGVVLMLLLADRAQGLLRRRREVAGMTRSTGPTGRRVMAGPIVVGYDGTEGAKAALAEALRLAGPLGAEVVLGFA